MQAGIINALLVVVAVLAATLRAVGQRANSGMTKKQKTMLWRILAATVLLLGLQIWVRRLLNGWGAMAAGCGSPAIWRIMPSLDTTFCERPIRAFAMGRFLMKTF